MAFKSFEYDFDLPETSDDYRREVQTKVTPWLATARYQLTSQDGGSFTYVRRYIPGIYIFLAVILFPIGLLFLLIKDTATIVISIEADEADSGVFITGQEPVTNVVITGQAPPEISRMLGDVTGATPHGAPTPP